MAIGTIASGPAVSTSTERRAGGRVRLVEREDQLVPELDRVRVVVIEREPRERRLLAIL